MENFVANFVSHLSSRAHQLIIQHNSQLHKKKGKKDMQTLIQPSLSIFNVKTSRKKFKETRNSRKSCHFLEYVCTRIEKRINSQLSRKTLLTIARSERCLLFFNFISAFTINNTLRNRKHNVICILAACYEHAILSQHFRVRSNNERVRMKQTNRPILSILPTSVHI